MAEVLRAIHFRGLQIEEDLPLQQKLWGLERAGWIVLSLFVALGLLGVLGNGPLSSSKATDPSGTFSTRYERFVHNDTQTTLELQIDDPASDGLQWIALSADYAASVQIERVMPEPERTIITDQEVRFGFEPGQDGEKEVVGITLTPVHAGVLRAELRSGAGRALHFMQLVYP